VDDRSIKPDLAIALNHINEAAIILSKCAAGRLAGVIGPEQPNLSGTVYEHANRTLTQGAASLVSVADDLKPLVEPSSHY